MRLQIAYCNLAAQFRTKPHKPQHITNNLVEKSIHFVDALFAELSRNPDGSSTAEGHGDPQPDT